MNFSIKENILIFNTNLSLKYYNNEYFRKYVDLYMTKKKLKITLIFNMCKNIKNVYMLNLVHKLFLNRCPNIIDISNLYSIYTLYLIINIIPNYVYGLHLLKNIHFIHTNDYTLHTKKLRKYRKKNNKQIFIHMIN